MDKFTRRGFLWLSGVGIVTPYISISANAAAQSELITPLTNFDPSRFRFDTSRSPEEVFSLSIASGDPSPTGVILWTRIDPRVWAAGENLSFEVALDPEFKQGLIQGMVEGNNIQPDRDYTVKIDLDGRLSPNRSYYYRFIYRNTASRIGRCRTLPQATESVSRMKFAVVTCQDFKNGYYGAFSHLAQESDVDFVIHLGDFIYETGSDTSEGGVPFPDRQIVLPSGQSAAIGLTDYRHLYRTYRADPFLQHALERYTWINIWDDHETANDSYWDYARDTLGAPDHPLANDAARLRQLKLDSQRAWTEYLPARVTINNQATHPHQYLQIYRKFRFGNLLELFMTDQRTYRSSHPCGEGRFVDRYASPGCGKQSDSNRTMLGRTQRDWLVQGVIGSNALWKVWGNEVFQAPLRLTQTARSVYINLDSWDGYTDERSYIARQFKQAAVRNLIVLTGDLHTSLASLLKINYTIDPLNILQSNMVGVEFMTPAVTSANLGQFFDIPGLSLDFSELAVKLTNPHIRFFDSSHWGYSTVEFNNQHCEYTVFDIDKAENNASARKRVRKRLRVPLNNIKIIES